MAADISPVPVPESFPNEGAGGERKGKGLLRERFDDAKLIAVDAAMGKKDSWAKKVGDGSSGVLLADIPKFLGALGLKLVDGRRICITPEELAHYQACETLACGHLVARKQQPKLDQDSF